MLILEKYLKSRILGVHINLFLSKGVQNTKI